MTKQNDKPKLIVSLSEFRRLFVTNPKAIEDGYFELRRAYEALCEENARLSEIVERGLKPIIYHVDSNRARGWHIYPTRLRDNAIWLLHDAGIEVLAYTECERATQALDGGEASDE